MLAQEIRKIIVDTVSTNGGHLASSLGTVELTLAIHYIFSSPKDKIIWDVGHQAYAHKLITGRRKSFNTLRKLNGISGFTKISESPYDAFTTGHSSTSISAGLGIACGKRLKNDFSKVVAVIGDGSLTAGLSYEGLNQTGDIHHDKDLIVILNDNKMSISKNVGALSSLLSRTLSTTRLQTMRREFGEFIKSIPKIGSNIYKFIKKSEGSLRSFITPGILFEAFNLEYFGPIDGHNLVHLINILHNIREIDEPVLLHVITKKGKGYDKAEKNPIYFHGVGSFDVSTGFCSTSRNDGNKVSSYTDVFGNAMVELAKSNDKIIAVTAAMPEGTGLNSFKKLFPERFFDVGIAEQHGVTFAAGMATEGFIPVVAIYSTFLQRAYDQILHDVCIESLPVVFAIDRGGIVGEDGPTHHGLFDFSYLRNIPNMVVMAPKDENELRCMLHTAISYGGPISLRYPRGKVIGAVNNAEVIKIPIGKAEILSEGSKILLIGVGNSVNEVVIAADLLEKNHKISATVVNARFVKPLDSNLIIKMAKKFDKIVTAEENVLQGGFGSAVLELLVDNGIRINTFKRVGIDDFFIEHGEQKELRSKYCVDAESIVHTALSCFA